MKFLLLILFFFALVIFNGSEDDERKPQNIRQPKRASRPVGSDNIVLKPVPNELTDARESAFPHRIGQYNGAEWELPDPLGFGKYLKEEVGPAIKDHRENLNWAEKQLDEANRRDTGSGSSPSPRDGRNDNAGGRGPGAGPSPSPGAGCGNCR